MALCLNYQFKIIPRMFSEVITLKGHIIDSLTLAKVLDKILVMGGSFTVLDIEVGKKPSEISYATLRIEAETLKSLNKVIATLTLHGAVLQKQADITLEKALKGGVFPEEFYSTSNLETWVHHENRWSQVKGQEMDIGVRYNPETKTFHGTPMSDVKKGELYVVGHEGIRVTPLEKETERHGFQFMSSEISTEKPKARLVFEAARQIRENRRKGLKNLFVLGPAVVHSGGSDAVVELIEMGCVDILFAGNALAAHDIEAAFFGTSLGVSLEGGDYAEHGNEHHLRAINRIRKAGSIKNAVKKGELKSGIMHACVTNNVPYILAGSIRDDGPLPEVMSDCMEVQKVLRKKIKKVGTTVVVGTVLHGIAVGNLLPASVPIICADINPSSFTKFTDRGSIQSLGIVMDGASFLQELANNLRNT